MCLVIFAHQPGAAYPLVMAANRDEYHGRATAAARFWPEHPQLLAGRDLEQGGTWMGITRSGRFATITNYHDPARTVPAPHSRGELPLTYLLGQQSPQDYLRAIAPTAQDYAGFNLLLGDGHSLWHLSNCGPDQVRQPHALAPGLYGLSNASLNTPWPKVTLGKDRLQQLLQQGPPNHETLATVVGSKVNANPQELQFKGQNDDERAMEQLLSAQFISAGPYGTRASTTLWTTNGGEVDWQERSYNQDGVLTGSSKESFRVEARS
jgi:uncharacterized protein with NRDE domain